MKDSQLSRIATELGVSRSTVSKVVNHCYGVSCELRSQLLDSAREHGLTGKIVSECDVYVILPEIPAYFWGAVYRCLRDALCARSWKVKYNIISQLDDTQSLAHYLDEVEALQPRVLILAAKCPALNGRLSELAIRCAVFSLCEETQPANVFYFGSSGMADGGLLAERLHEESPQVQRVLLLGGDEARRTGFCKAAPDREVHHLPLRMADTAAQLARSMIALRESFPFEAVVCLDGITGLACLALKKCRLTLPCYGFEDPFINPRCPHPQGEVVQDIPAITAALADATDVFLQRCTMPPQKVAYLPSRYVRHPHCS